MKQFFKLLSLSMALFVAIGLTNCSEDDEPAVTDTNTPTKLSIDDPDVVSEAVSVSGATMVEGTFPGATGDANSPVISIDGEEEGYAIAGSIVTIYIDETTDANVGGIYLQVDGASKFYDIPMSSLYIDGGRINNGRISKRSKKDPDSKMMAYLAMSLDISEELEAGKFCISYAVYTQEGLVSNSATLCINVLEPGGENSEFLTGNDWAQFSEYFYEDYQGNSYEYTDTVGVSDLYEYNTDIDCGDGTFQTFSVISEYRVNYLNLNLSTDGAVASEEEYYEKQINYNNSTCQGVVYDELTAQYQEKGSWSYNDDENILTILYLDEETDDNGATYYETSPIRYQVSVADGNLILTEEYGVEGSGDYSKTVFIYNPKN